MGFRSDAIEQTGTTSGLVLPRVTTLQMLAITTGVGSLVYNLDDESVYIYTTADGWIVLETQISLTVIDGGDA